MAELPKLDVVIGNNFGHLPMFVGAEKGFFKNHGVDAKMLVVDTGTDMVNAMHDGRAQIGDMSTTTYLKAVHAGEPFKVIGLIMNDATRDNCDDPLAIVTKKGRGIAEGKVTDLKGKTIGLARGQTSDEYFKMVLRRAKMKYEDLTIENIWSQFGLAPALAEGKVDAVVSWEPYVTQVLDPGAGLVSGDPRRPVHVLRDGGDRARADRRSKARPGEGDRRRPRAVARTSRATTVTRRWRFSPNGCRRPTWRSAKRR